MTEEEKQAIKTVKQYKKCFIFETVHEETGERLNDYSNAIDIVLNLIDKQQKEIEEKATIIMAGAEKVKQLEKEIEELKKENIELINQRTEGYWENDRLKKEIETLKETHKEFLKLHQELKAEDTLLGTDNILNAIEKKYISKDKIREKIKELEKEKTEVIHELDFKGFYTLSQLKDIEISVLKELLEE